MGKGGGKRGAKPGARGWVEKEKLKKKGSADDG